MADKCPKCECLMELYSQTPKTPRDYWVMTELFVMLHGSDTCQYELNKQSIKLPEGWNKEPDV